MFLHVFYGRQHFEAICRRTTATHLSNFAKDCAPIVCRCSSTVASHGKFPRLESAGDAYSHSRTSRSSRRLGCDFDSSIADTSIPAQVQEVGDSPLEKASSSFISSFKASRRLISVCFLFEAPCLLVMCRGVVVPDSTRERDVSILRDGIFLGCSPISR